MQKDNPAVRECPKDARTIHTWRRNPDGTAHCVNCGQPLNREQTADCFGDDDAQ